MKVVAQHRRARFEYEILDTVESGIMLTGQETKATRAGQANLAGAYITFADGVPLLRHASIAPYAYASDVQDYDPNRDRVLLLRRREIERLHSAIAEKGVTLVPLEIRAGRTVKVLIALARGRKTIDKRHHIREREQSRRMRQGGMD